MKLNNFKIVSSTWHKDLPSEVLSMKPFIAYLKNKIETAGAHKQKVLSFLIDQFESQPGVSGGLSLQQISEYTDLLQLMYLTTSPIIEEENLHFWALSMPVSQTILYSTNAFFNAVAAEHNGNPGKNVAELDEEEIHNNQLETCYSLILRQCYEVNYNFKQEFIYPFKAEPNGFTSYFKIGFDNRFIRVAYDGELPSIALDTNNYTREQLLTILQDKLPLSQFRFEGIRVMNITDVTMQYLVENLHQKMLCNSCTTPPDYYPTVFSSLKSLTKSNDIQFGFFPLLRFNSKYLLDRQNCANSLLIDIFEQQGPENEDYYFLGEKYFRNPGQVFLKEIPVPDGKNFTCINVLNAENIKTYALVPIFLNKSLCGVLEIYSRKENLFNEEVFRQVAPVIPFISQIFQKNIENFKREIDRIIKKNFTAVQPAVQHKFNEAAWHYLRDMQSPKVNGNGHKGIGDIAFEKVYPLYCAVDVRNSTIERNEALLKDLKIEFNILLSVLSKLKERLGFGLIDEKIFLCEKWINKINQNESFNQENLINEFLENEIIPFLKDVTSGDPNLAVVTSEYFKAIDEKTGTSTENRRQLEHSMNTVIGAVNNYLELMKEETQKAYPCYFEKFRTDGVEYDIYIGQSMAPDKPFSDIYLKNLRLMQLSSMATIAKHTRSLLPELVKPIETTQLIFIHSHPIDIRFRKDEKRFDVEGAYNIRYHIVKKRIDKVLIKGTNERLTVPNKIAMVYFSQHEADEYVSYVRFLIEKGILEDDLEYLELEQPQGISELKAMRVGVKAN